MLWGRAESVERLALIFCTRLTMMIYAISCLWSMVLSGEAIGSIPRIISCLLYTSVFYLENPHGVIADFSGNPPYEF